MRVVRITPPLIVRPVLIIGWSVLMIWRLSPRVPLGEVRFQNFYFYFNLN